MKTIAAILPRFVLGALCAALPMQAADAVVLQIKADQVTAKVSPMLYGHMTEEINFSYDGGLYAELVRNRAFKEDPKEPVHWQLVKEAGGAGSMALDPSQPFNAAIATSLKLTVAIVSNDGVTTHARAQVARITGSWQKYQVTLTTGPTATGSTSCRSSPT